MRQEGNLPLHTLLLLLLLLLWFIVSLLWGWIHIQQRLRWHLAAAAGSSSSRAAVLTPSSYSTSVSSSRLPLVRMPQQTACDHATTM